jgi:hypothetical protein
MPNGIEYVGPLDAETAQRGRFRAEIQIEPVSPMESREAVLDLRLHHHASGDELITAELSRIQALALRTALDEWLEASQ